MRKLLKAEKEEYEVAAHQPITKPYYPKTKNMVVLRQLHLAKTIEYLDSKIAANPHGQCLMDTFRFFLYKELIGEGEDWLLIHAIIGEGEYDGWSGEILPAHAHAAMYNKKEKKIYEVSNNERIKHISLPFMEWVKEGNVTKIKQYTLEEVGDKMEEHGNLVFFHLEEAGKYREMLDGATKFISQEEKMRRAAASILEL